MVVKPYFYSCFLFVYILFTTESILIKQLSFSPRQLINASAYLSTQTSLINIYTIKRFRNSSIYLYQYCNNITGKQRKCEPVNRTTIRLCTSIWQTIRKFTNIVHLIMKIKIKNFISALIQLQVHIILLDT